jgi:hypothetical protein
MSAEEVLTAFRHDAPYLFFVLSKTSLVNTPRGKRWKGNISRSTRWICADA